MMTMAITAMTISPIVVTSHQHPLTLSLSPTGRRESWKNLPQQPAEALLRRVQHGQSSRHRGDQTDGPHQRRERREGNHTEEEVRQLSIPCCAVINTLPDSLLHLFSLTLSHCLHLISRPSHLSILSPPSFSLAPHTYSSSHTPPPPPLPLSYTGHMRFIGEIYMCGLVTMTVMKFCIEELIKSDEVSERESVCVVD